jgi:flagellar secretion chaperone FliS
MSYASQQAMRQYQHVGVEARVAEASPHGLVQMLLRGALVRIAAARGALEAGDVTRKGELIGRAIDIVEGLRISLDLQRGGAIAANLADLYRYIARLLVEANLHGDAARLAEAAGLLEEINSAWQAIAAEVA